jgi:methyl-accepting chemotaxis protein
MIKGYTHLNENIDKTIELINDVTAASQEQQSGIVQINDAITTLDSQTQENASIASQTNDIAQNTSSIAKTVVQSADEKEFEGKHDIKSE